MMLSLYDLWRTAGSGYFISSAGSVHGGRHVGAMGCGLRKMKLASEESSPGKIYSTLKRPQVETKVGVAYTYRYLDFLIGKDGR